jgi:hypothetical protein
VGKRERNSEIFASLPAFHFARDEFSKTGAVWIVASGAVMDLVSTFPTATVTATGNESHYFSFP